MLSEDSAADAATVDHMCTACCYELFALHLFLIRSARVGTNSSWAERSSEQ